MEEECLAGDLCDIPQSKLSPPQAGNGRLPPPEIELDLDCWQVGAAGPRCLLLRLPQYRPKALCSKNHAESLILPDLLHAQYTLRDRRMLPRRP